MLASFQASMLNQKPSDLGILNQLKLDPSRSSPYFGSQDCEVHMMFQDRCPPLLGWR